MKRLFDYADQYVQQSDWKDFALVKFCLFSMGILAGMYIPKKKKEYVQIVSITVFLATYIPLMAKFFKIVKDNTD